MIFDRLVEQPFKIPHIAATILYANDINGDVAKEMLTRVSSRAQEAVDSGCWREFKLLLRFLACLQGILEGDGVFPLLDELFSRAADQQTASQEDVSWLNLLDCIVNWNRPSASNWSKSFF
jgi:nuclear cap-binding protein subunit 1